MSCSFWNMRRRLRAQKQKDTIITNLAAAQAEEKATTEAEEKAVTDSDNKRTSRKAKTRDSSD